MKILLSFILAFTLLSCSPDVDQGKTQTNFETEIPGVAQSNAITSTMAMAGTVFMSLIGLNQSQSTTMKAKQKRLS